MESPYLITIKINNTLTTTITLADDEAVDVMDAVEQAKFEARQQYIDWYENFPVLNSRIYKGEPIKMEVTKITRKQ